MGSDSFYFDINIVINGRYKKNVKSKANTFCSSRGRHEGGDVFNVIFFYNE